MNEKKKEEIQEKITQLFEDNNIEPFEALEIMTEINWAIIKYLKNEERYVTKSKIHGQNQR